MSSYLPVIVLVSLAVLDGAAAAAALDVGVVAVVVGAVQAISLVVVVNFVVVVAASAGIKP